MNDFDYDALQKKRIAAGDRHRKRGSRNHKCSLPQDHMTLAQLRRMNGPVKTYNLKQPMRWIEFTSMPEDLQKQYLTGLIATYSATNRMLGAMMGVTGATVYQRQKYLGIPPVRTRHTTVVTRAERDRAWEAFCTGATVEPVEEAPAPEEPEKDQDRYLDLTGFNAEFTGPFNPESLANWLAAFPIHGTPSVKIRVEVEIEGGGSDGIPAHAAPADRH